MKFKTTKKAVLSGYNNVISVQYSGLESLLNLYSPIAYTTRVEGWGADIYDMGGGTAIVTGYSPFGTHKASYELCTEIDSRASDVWHDHSLTFDEQKSQIEKLTREFITRVLS